MDAPPPSSTGARFAPLAAGIALALPVLVAPYPPMGDLPYHELMVAIARHLGDQTRFPRGLYEVHLGHPNTLFHLVAWALAYAMPVGLACKLVAAASVAAVPLGAAQLAAWRGVSRWSAVLVAPLALGWTFMMGLVMNLEGLALLLAFLPWADALARAPSAKGAARVTAACALVYLAHEGMLIVYAGALTLFAGLAALREGGRGLAVRGWALAPVALSAVAVLADDHVQKAYMTRAMQSVATTWDPLSVKLASLPRRLFLPYDGVASLALVGVLALGAALLGAAYAREPRADCSLVARLDEARYAVLAVVLFALYLAFPSVAHAHTWVYERFLAPAVAVGLVAIAPSDGAPASRVLPLVAAVAPAATLAVVWPAFVGSSRSARAVEALASHVAPASAVMTLVDPDIDPETYYFDRPTMAARVVSERGGRLLYSFSEALNALVVMPPEHEWGEPVARVISGHGDVCPAYDLGRFRYVMYLSASNDVRARIARALAPDARFVARAGDWTLFESTHAVTPVLDADGAGPGACEGGWLSDRFERAGGH